MMFEVSRQDLRQTRAIRTPQADLADGQIRLSVERFALTSNNITYAVAGDMLDYWGFFPAEAPWGRIPAIGLATVTESSNADIHVGGRYFGFYPMGTELVIDASPRGEHGFRDAGPHRARHAAIYTDFRNIEEDPDFDLERVDEYLLLYGMFMTSFLVDDQLGDRTFEGATSTIVTSASSKTSIALATCLAGRADISAIGLTSARNRAFVEGLGLYDQVATYDEVDELDASERTGMVDMAGSSEIRAAVHTHFGDALAFSINVGATHWEEMPAGEHDIPGPKPEFFFAPGQAAKRVEDWGPAELQARINHAYRRMVDQSTQWLRIEHRQGSEGIEDTYRDLLEGRAEPSSGFVCSMHTGHLS
ncbi:MAG: DUF2855 family protein [Actinomycetia bacterium]|nr:DUF2855 family protein [Actinomycetes bacterium]